MQVGFTIGLTFGQSQMQTQFAFSELLYMQINVPVAKQILLAFWQAVKMHTTTTTTTTSTSTTQNCPGK